MGCGASTADQTLSREQQLNQQKPQQQQTVNNDVKNEHKEKKKKDKKKKKRNSSSSSSSSDSSSDSSDDEQDMKDVVTKTLLREFLEREIDMLTIELTQPEVLLKQLLEQKDLNTNQLVKNSNALREQQQICVREYHDLTNLQQLIQQRANVAQETWDKEQSEYVEAFNKHKQMEASQKTLERQSIQLDTKIHVTSVAVQKLLKLRKRQDHVLLKAFDGSYGSEREAQIEEYVDKMREYRKNILNTKAQWLRALDFTKHSNLQYWRAVQVWSSIMKQSPNGRPHFCSYIANYLQAAYTNSTHAINCMKAHAHIPYFTDKMLTEVEVSRRNAYKACQPRYHQTFLQWLWYYQQNAASLEKWISKTLVQTIEGDLIKVNGYLTVAEADLRAERKMLIIAKVKAKYGADVVEEEVAEQEAEVERLSEELSKLKSVAIQTNVATVDSGSDSGIGSDSEDGPPPAPGTKSEEDVVKQGPSEDEQRAATEAAAEATKQAALAVEQAKHDAVERVKAEEASQQKLEEEKMAQAAEEESRRKLDDARAKIASLEQETEALEREKAEAEKAQAEAVRLKTEEVAAARARVVAEEAAANAAAEHKDELVKEAREASEVAERAKADALKWTKLAEEAAAKAQVEMKASSNAALEREAAEKEAKEAEEAANRAKEDLQRAIAETAAAKKAQQEKEELANKADEDMKKAERAARTKEAETKLASGTEPELKSDEASESTLNFETDIDGIMNDYKASVQQYEKKRGTEVTRMDLDLQEKLRARRKRRRQQMKQKLEEQKILAAKTSVPATNNEQ